MGLLGGVYLVGDFLFGVFFVFSVVGTVLGCCLDWGLCWVLFGVVGLLWRCCLGGYFGFCCFCHVGFCFGCVAEDLVFGIWYLGVGLGVFGGCYGGIVLFVVFRDLVLVFYLLGRLSSVLLDVGLGVGGLYLRCVCGVFICYAGWVVGLGNGGFGVLGLWVAGWVLFGVFCGVVCILRLELCAAGLGFVVLWALYIFCPRACFVLFC